MKIETGRYTIPTPTPVEERVCDLCGVLEDEERFLIIWIIATELNFPVTVLHYGLSFEHDLYTQIHFYNVR